MIIKYKSMEIKATEIKKLISMMEGEEEERRELKTIPMRKEWRHSADTLAKQKSRMVDLIEKLEAEKNKYDTLHNAFWSQVEIDLNDFNHRMRYDVKSDEIIIFANKDEDAK